MVKDYHPTPDIREFERSWQARAGGRAIVLTLSAIDYGTHTGAMFRARDKDGAEIVTVPFEAHWHQRGRYLVQAGPAKTGGDETLADAIAELAGVHVTAAITAAQARAKSRPDMFDGLEAWADGALSTIAKECM
ncbi:MAG: hypothetical protein AB7F96_11080 [Beijerinckiaceae bacterium]